MHRQKSPRRNAIKSDAIRHARKRLVGNNPHPNPQVYGVRRFMTALWATYHDDGHLQSQGCTMSTGNHTKWSPAHQRHYNGLKVCVGPHVSLHPTDVQHRIHHSRPASKIKRPCKIYSKRPSRAATAPVDGVIPATSKGACFTYQLIRAMSECYPKRRTIARKRVFAQRSTNTLTPPRKNKTSSRFCFATTPHAQTRAHTCRGRTARYSPTEAPTKQGRYCGLQECAGPREIPLHADIAPNEKHEPRLASKNALPESIQ